MKIFADTSVLEEIRAWHQIPLIVGFTTNPTLMRKAGITDYERFCKEVLSVTDKPVSFEVFADDKESIERQARLISSWGKNVYVKIPITDTRGNSSVGIIKDLEQEIKLNITAVFSTGQVLTVSKVLHQKIPTIISVFAGRIADTGRDPVPFIRRAKALAIEKAEVLWASPREVLNIYQAEEAGADIITCTPDIIKKYITTQHKDLLEFSRETVRMFYDDAKASGLQL